MISKQIAELRRAKGWTQEDLSAKTGISRVVISRYEKNTQPSKANLMKIIKAFGLPEDYFVEKVLSKKARPIDSTVLKKKLNEVYRFSTADQNRMIEMIDLVLEKMQLLQKINKIKRL